MPLAENIKAEIDSLITHLIEIGLCEAQNFPTYRAIGDGVFEVGLSRNLHSSIPLRDTEYVNVYSELREKGAFNIKMLDGALLILHYRVTPVAVVNHRLAFFPSPILEDFQGAPEKYFEEQLYADIVEKRIVPFPIRFDYANSLETDVLPGHPDCHLTLGQYSGCRIPVSSPLSPVKFVDFIIQHFYNPALERHWHRPMNVVPQLDPCLVNDEQASIHVVVP